MTKRISAYKGPCVIGSYYTIGCPQRPTPSAGRVAVWRKLKQLGALLVHDSVWVLPDTPWTGEQFRWLAAEIAKQHGDAYVWQAQGTMLGQDAALRARFVAASEEEYQSIWHDLERGEPDRTALSKRYQKARRRDYFGCPLGQPIYDALRAGEDSS